VLGLSLKWHAVMRSVCVSSVCVCARVFIFRETTAALMQQLCCASAAACLHPALLCVCVPVQAVCVCGRVGEQH
jgi:hypothetical protein